MDDSRVVDSSQPLCELTGDRDDKSLLEFITRGSHLEPQYIIISKIFGRIIYIKKKQIKVKNIK